MSKIGQRGKNAEKEVKKVLDTLNAQYLRFAYERLPDARAAGGRLGAQLCDFLCWWYNPDNERSYSIQLEVKETAHNYRLQKDKLEQLARLRKVELAGGLGIVLIYHSTLDKWRAVTVGYFDGEIPPSWDLSDEPLHDSAAAALNWVGGFPPVVVR